MVHIFFVLRIVTQSLLASALCQHISFLELNLHYAIVPRLPLRYFQLPTAMFMHLTNTSTRELGCPSSTSLNGLSVHSVKSTFATTTTSTPTHLRKHDRNANTHKGHNNAPRSPNRCTRPHHSVSRCSKLSEPYVHMSSTAQP